MINCQKNLFSIEKDIHYLNCAYMAPILRESEKLAIDAIHRQRNPHTFKPHHFFEITQKIRNEFGKLICSSYENIAIMPSTSYGFANAFFGSGAGSGNTGSYNTVVGAGAEVSGASNGGITIGYGATSGAAGTYATLGYGGSKSWISLGATGWSGSSDERLKENIRPSEAGLAFINDLKPVNFDWRKRKDIDAELANHKAESDARYEQDNPIGKIGFIAQDVKAALDKHPNVI